MGSLKSAPAEAGTRTKAPTVLAAGPGGLPGAVISPWKPLRVFWLMAATLTECKEGDPLGECDFTVPCPGCEGNQASAVSLRVGVLLVSLPGAVFPPQTQFCQGEGYSAYLKSLNPGVTGIVKGSVLSERKSENLN